MPLWVSPLGCSFVSVINECWAFSATAGVWHHLLRPCKFTVLYGCAIVPPYFDGFTLPWFIRLLYSFEAPYELQPKLKYSDWCSTAHTARLLALQHSPNATLSSILVYCISYRIRSSISFPLEELLILTAGDIVDQRITSFAHCLILVIALFTTASQWATENVLS